MSVVSDQRKKDAIQNRFNPIRGLTPTKLSQQLDSFRLGYLRECALLWDAMIRRDPLLRNVVSKRYKAVARAQWEILTVDDSPEALLQKRVLEKFYNNLTATDVLDENERGGFGLLLRLMMSAMGMRYAAFEIVWRRIEGNGKQIGTSQRKRTAARSASGATQEPDVHGGSGVDESGVTFVTAEFRKVPLEFFENRTGRLQFLQSDYDMEGKPLEKGGWLVAVGDGIMEATSVAYMFKQMALKDWVACSEMFGTPIPWIRTGAALNSPEWQQLETAASQLMAQKSIVTGDNDKLELIEMKGSANLPFPSLVELCDRAMASLWRGADLSTISQGQAGVGASLQGEESDLLLEDDAKWLAEILWDQVDLPVLRYALGVTEPLAYVSILPPKRKNVEQDIKIDEFLSKHGFKLSQDDAGERYGRALAEPGQPILEVKQVSPEGGLPGQGPVASKKGLENSRDEELRLLKAKRNLLRPVVGRLREIESLAGDEKRNALIALASELPALKVKLANEAAAGDVADELGEIIVDALKQGFSKKETR
ncbi:MAG TPA: DUF935 family protein [Verrucomicrobiae bacterium]|nr:DUF935 family protein [Verrucomicrobiae bacterium]